MALPDLLDLSRPELEAWCAAAGVPTYRAAQITAWLYRHGVREFAAAFRIGWPEVAHVSRSTDGTRKLLLRLDDGATIESVLIPDVDRLTLCVSTQVGCAMGCGFCATATLGLGRHLRRGEIIAQLLTARALVTAEADIHDGPERITNMVFMGMGEPLHNYAGTVGAIETLTSSWGVEFSHRRITVSTVGLLPEMRRLLTDTRVNLAV